MQLSSVLSVNHNDSLYSHSRARCVVMRIYNVYINKLPDVFKHFQVEQEWMKVLGVPVDDEDYHVQFGIEKVIGAREVQNAIALINNDKLKYDLTRVLSNISKPHYSVSNMEYIEDSNDKFYVE